MVCPSDDEETLHRLVIVAVAVSALPLAAFLYALIVWFTYTLYGEISWKNPVYLRSIVLRWVVVVVSWAASAGVVAMCGSCGEIISGRSRGCLIGTSLAIAVVFAAFSAKLMMRTRKEDVVGIEMIPFYGSSFLEGKFVVVTGANNGIGFETTRQLAAQGATVAMLCRNPNRAKKAIEDIVKLQADLHAKDPLGYPTATIAKDKLLFVPVDLTDFDSVRKATDTIEQILLSRRKKFQTDQPCYVDALVCNAGLMMDIQSTTKDGLETMMQANHLGHFLLMKTMFEKRMLKTEGNDTTIRSNEPSRVCILTSTTYKFTASTTGFDFVDPYCSKGQRQYTLFGQYSMSKLANLLHSRDLARRYNDNPATHGSESALAVFAVHPGVVRTNVISNMAWYHRWGDRVFAWIIAAISKTPEEGAYSTVYTVAATLDEIPFWKKGSYVVNCQQHPTDPYVDAPNGKVDAMRLWEWSEEQISEGAVVNINGTKGDGEKKEQ